MMRDYSLTASSNVRISPLAELYVRAMLEKGKTEKMSIVLSFPAVANRGDVAVFVPNGCLAKYHHLTDRFGHYQKVTVGGTSQSKHLRM